MGFHGDFFGGIFCGIRSYSKCLISFLCWTLPSLAVTRIYQLPLPTVGDGGLEAMSNFTMGK